MNIPVLLEATSTGFRASTQSPFQLAVEGETEAATMAAFTVALRGQLSNGRMIRSVALPEPAIALEYAEKMRSNPVHADMLRSIEEYRKTANAVEDVD
jgi:hypothetical protein